MDKHKQRNVFFCHIPKTAGTTLRTSLENAFQPHQILPDARMMQESGGTYSSIDDVLSRLGEHPGSARLVRGHYHIEFRKFLNRPVVVSVLRNPRERTISHLKHLVRAGHSMGSIMSSMDAGVLPIPDNQMSRYLGSVSEFVSNKPYKVQNRNRLSQSPIEDTKALLRSAIDNLSDIHVLGISEDLESFSDVLKAAGLNFDPKQRLNVIKTDLPIRTSHLELIDEKNSLDIELYAAAKSVIAERGGTVTL